MLPYLLPGKLVIARRGPAVDRLNLGDIVVFRHNHLLKIKRVAKIDRNKIYVVGDNAAESTDSRHFGWVDSGSVVGKVIWPRKLRKTYQH